MADSALEKWTQCGAVRPFWEVIGLIRWSGSSEQEKLFNIKYVRCKNAPGPPIQKDGLTYHVCAEHRE